MGFEIRVDCPACRVEGARIETWETDAPSGRLGLPIAARCRLCGQASAAMVETSPARVPGGGDELHRALAAWAIDEGLSSPEELVEGCFVLSAPAEILAALARGEAVETTFDVVDFLFSSGHGQGGGADAAHGDERASPAALPRDAAPGIASTSPAPVFAAAASPSPEDRPPPSVAGGAASVRRVGGPRDELLALASVAASDGEASEGDLEELMQAAARRGIPPLAPEDVRVRRPVEIDPPPTLVRREQVLEEMFWMAWSDRELDESEVRVVRDFARAWGVDPQRVTEWTAIATSRGSSRIARWIDRVGYFLFPGW